MVLLNLLVLDLHLCFERHSARTSHLTFRLFIFVFRLSNEGLAFFQKLVGPNLRNLWAVSAVENPWLNEVYFLLESLCLKAKGPFLKLRAFYFEIKEIEVSSWVVFSPSLCVLEAFEELSSVFTQFYTKPEPDPIIAFLSAKADLLKLYFSRSSLLWNWATLHLLGPRSPKGLEAGPRGRDKILILFADCASLTKIAGLLPKLPPRGAVGLDFWAFAWYFYLANAALSLVAIRLFQVFLRSLEGFVRPRVAPLSQKVESLQIKKKITGMVGALAFPLGRYTPGHRNLPTRVAKALKRVLFILGALLGGLSRVDHIDLARLKFRVRSSRRVPPGPLDYTVRLVASKAVALPASAVLAVYGACGLVFYKFLLFSSFVVPVLILDSCAVYYLMFGTLTNFEKIRFKPKGGKTGGKSPTPLRFKGDEVWNFPTLSSKPKALASCRAKGRVFKNLSLRRKLKLGLTNLVRALPPFFTQNPHLNFTSLRPERGAFIELCRNKALSPCLGLLKAQIHKFRPERLRPTLWEGFGRFYLFGWIFNSNFQKGLSHKLKAKRPCSLPRLWGSGPFGGPKPFRAPFKQCFPINNEIREGLPTAKGCVKISNKRPRGGLLDITYILIEGAEAAYEHAKSLQLIRLKGGIGSQPRPLYKKASFIVLGLVYMAFSPILVWVAAFHDNPLAGPSLSHKSPAGVLALPEVKSRRAAFRASLLDFRGLLKPVPGEAWKYGVEPAAKIRPRISLWSGENFLVPKKRPEASFLSWAWCSNFIKISAQSRAFSNSLDSTQGRAPSPGSLWAASSKGRRQGSGNSSLISLNGFRAALALARDAVFKPVPSQVIYFNRPREGSIGNDLVALLKPGHGANPASDPLQPFSQSQWKMVIYVSPLQALKKLINDSAWRFLGLWVSKGPSLDTYFWRRYFAKPWESCFAKPARAFKGTYLFLSGHFSHKKYFSYFLWSNSHPSRGVAPVWTNWLQPSSWGFMRPSMSPMHLAMQTFRLVRYAYISYRFKFVLLPLIKTHVWLYYFYPLSSLTWSYPSFLEPKGLTFGWLGDFCNLNRRLFKLVRITLNPLFLWRSKNHLKKTDNDIEDVYDFILDTNNFESILANPAMDLNYGFGGYYGSKQTGGIIGKYENIRPFLRGSEPSSFFNAPINLSDVSETFYPHPAVYTQNKISRSLNVLVDRAWPKIPHSHGPTRKSKKNNSFDNPITDNLVSSHRRFGSSPNSPLRWEGSLVDSSSPRALTRGEVYSDLLHEGSANLNSEKSARRCLSTVERPTLGVEGAERAMSRKATAPRTPEKWALSHKDSAVEVKNLVRPEASEVPGSVAGDASFQVETLGALMGPAKAEARTQGHDLGDVFGELRWAQDWAKEMPDCPRPYARRNSDVAHSKYLGGSNPRANQVYGLKRDSEGVGFKGDLGLGRVRHKISNELPPSGPEGLESSLSLGPRLQVLRDPHGKVPHGSGKFQLASDCGYSYPFEKWCPDLKEFPELRPRFGSKVLDRARHTQHWSFQKENSPLHVYGNSLDDVQSLFGGALEGQHRYLAKYRFSKNPMSHKGRPLELDFFIPRNPVSFGYEPPYSQYRLRDSFPKLKSEVFNRCNSFSCESFNLKIKKKERASLCHESHPYLNSRWTKSGVSSDTLAEAGSLNSRCSIPPNHPNFQIKCLIHDVIDLVETCIGETGKAVSQTFFSWGTFTDLLSMFSRLLFFPAKIFQVLIRQSAENQEPGSLPVFDFKFEPDDVIGASSFIEYSSGSGSGNDIFEYFNSAFCFLFALLMQFVFWDWWKISDEDPLSRAFHIGWRRLDVVSTACMSGFFFSTFLESFKISSHFSDPFFNGPLTPRSQEARVMVIPIEFEMVRKKLWGAFWAKWLLLWPCGPFSKSSAPFSFGDARRLGIEKWVKARGVSPWEMLVHKPRSRIIYMYHQVKHQFRVIPVWLLKMSQWFGVLPHVNWDINAEFPYFFRGRLPSPRKPWGILSDKIYEGEGMFHRGWLQGRLSYLLPKFGTYGHSHVNGDRQSWNPIRPFNSASTFDISHYWPAYGLEEPRDRSGFDAGGAPHLSKAFADPSLGGLDVASSYERLQAAKLADALLGFLKSPLALLLYHFGAYPYDAGKDFVGSVLFKALSAITFILDLCKRVTGIPIPPNPCYWWKAPPLMEVLSLSPYSFPALLFLEALPLQLRSCLACLARPAWEVGWAQALGPDTPLRFYERRQKTRHAITPFKKARPLGDSR